MTQVPAVLEPLLAGSFQSQPAFGYGGAERWLSRTGHLAGVREVIDEAFPAELDRPTVTRIVTEHLDDHPAGAFVAAMMWGHGTSGYGPYRTASILTGDRSRTDAPLSDEVARRLQEAARIARGDGPREGYWYLNNRSAGKIAGLGPAFFTKWLYFTTSGGDPAAAAPVLDRLVLGWLRRHAPETPIRPGFTDDYQRYVELLRGWGEPHGLGPAQVEERIFRLVRTGG